MVGRMKTVTSLSRIMRRNGVYELSYVKYLKNNVMLQINRKNVDITKGLVATYLATM